jgi:hypothetical protein
MTSNPGESDLSPIELSSLTGEAMRPLVTRVLGGWVALLLVLNVVALALSHRTDAPLRPVSVASAANATLAARTARVYSAQTMAVSGLGAHSHSSTSGEGVIDFSGQLSRITLNAKGLGHTILLKVGSAIYFEFPGPARTGLHIATPWVALDLGSLAGSGAALPGSNDLASTLRDLQAGSLGTVTGFRTVGEERVRGVRTTRVEAHLDKAAILKRASDFSGLGVSLAGADMRVATEDLWISADGLIRRTRNHAEIALAGRISTADQTTEFYDFGTSTGSIVAPPASEVTRYSSFLNLMQGIQG